MRIHSACVGGLLVFAGCFILLSSPDCAAAQAADPPAVVEPPASPPPAEAASEAEPIPASIEETPAPPVRVADTPAPPQEASAARDPFAQLDAIQREVAGIRQAVDELLAREREELQEEARRRIVKAQLVNYPVGRLAATTVVLAVATAGFTWLTVANDVMAAPLAVTAISGALTTVAAATLGRVVRKRRALRRGILARAP